MEQAGVHVTRLLQYNNNNNKKKKVATRSLMKRTLLLHRPADDTRIKHPVFFH